MQKLLSANSSFVLTVFNVLKINLLTMVSFAVFYRVLVVNIPFLGLRRHYPGCSHQASVAHQGNRTAFWAFSPLLPLWASRDVFY